MKKNKLTETIGRFRFDPLTLISPGNQAMIAYPNNFACHNVFSLSMFHGRYNSSTGKMFCISCYI